MSHNLEISTLGVLAVLLSGILLYIGVRQARSLLVRVSIGKTRRATLNRVRTVLEALVAIVFVVAVIPVVLNYRPEYSPFVVGAIIVTAVAVCWPALRDFVSGMFFKFGKNSSVGDDIEVDGIRGRVKGLGFRSMAVETDDREVAFVPYSRLARQPIVCRPRVDGVYPHTFQIDQPPGVDVVAARAMITQDALNCYWSSLVWNPLVKVTADGRLAVTVFALDEEHAHQIEVFVQRALADHDKLRPA